MNKLCPAHDFKVCPLTVALTRTSTDFLSKLLILPKSNMNSQDPLVVQLKALAFRIRSELQTNISAIQQEVMIFVNNKILDFEYTEEGPQFSKSQYEYPTKSFYRLPQAIADSIKTTLEYKNVLQSTGFDNTPLDANSLDTFVEAIADVVLNKADSIEEQIDAKIVVFLRDIYQEPFKFSALVELTGVVIELKNIELDSNTFKISLRQSRIEDLQKKQLIYPYYSSKSFSTRKVYMTPSLIIDIESYGTEPHIIQDEIQRIVTAFRLFEVSSADYISYSMDSEAILWNRKIGGTISSIKDIEILKKLKISKENASNLVNFYKSIRDVMPRGIYHLSTQERGMIHLTIAYRHYSEALLSTGRIEEKIMNTVIGLESLLLAENQEVSFRFWVRGAKILSLLNYPPLEVKNLLKTAYDIRSTFVHGDDLDLDKKLRKLNENQQATNSFLIKLLDYLRALIVMTIFLARNNEFIKSDKGSKNFNKKKFLDIVDDSLIAVERETQLRELLNCRNF